MINSDTIIHTLIHTLFILLFIVISHLMFSSNPVLEALGKALNALVFMVSVIALIIWKIT